MSEYSDSAGAPSAIPAISALKCLRFLCAFFASFPRADVSRRTGLALLAVLVLPLAWYSATHSIDFPMYHRAAVKVLHGNYDLYPHAYDEGPLQVDPLGQFLYAPVVAFFFTPLGLLPVQVAGFVFACLKIPAYFYVFSVIARRMDVQDRIGSIALLTILVLGGYLIEEFRGGNIHVFSVCLIVFAFDRADRGQVAAPAIAMATVIAVKLAPVLLLPYFAVRRRFAICAATIGVLGVLWAAPAAIVGFERNNELTEAFVRSAARIADRPDNVSLRGVLFRVLTPVPIGDPQNPPNNLADVPPSVVAAAWAVLATAIAIIVAAVVWRDPRHEIDRLLDLSLVLTTLLVIEPHTQRLYFSGLVVPVAVLIALLIRQPHLPFHRLIRAALVVTAAAATFLPLIFGGRSASLAYQAWSPYSIAAMFLLGTLIVVAREVRLPPSRSALRRPGKADTAHWSG